MRRKKINKDYHYIYEIPFVLEMKNSYDKIYNILKSNKIKSIDDFLDTLYEKNIDKEFINDIKIELKNCKLDNIEEVVSNYINIMYGSSDDFNNDMDGLYKVCELNDDENIIDKLENSFIKQKFENSFNLFTVKDISVVDFNYKNSTMNVSVCIGDEIESDQQFMISEYFEENCFGEWGNKIYEETQKDIGILLCRNTNGEINGVKLIEIIEPYNEDIDNDYFYGDDYDF